MSLQSALVRCIVALLSLSQLGVTAAATPDDALIEAGRRIYQQGVLPGGEPLLAVRPEGFEMEGEYAACVSCHRRSGMGSVEGFIDSTILVPPVAGTVLFAPSRFSNSYLDNTHHYVPNDAWERTLKRPAYDQQSLARALRDGLDPDGKPLLAPMPRYPLDDAAVAALTAYLKQLSTAPDPGVEPDALHLATVITPDVPADYAADALGVMHAWAKSAHSAARPWRLHEWKLSGPPQTWSAQLQQRYQQQPVFALLSGVGGAEWAPVHDFCERQRLPCMLPSVDVTPASAGDWYSMYYSPGVTLEARILASYLAEADAAFRGARIIQLYSDASGQHAAEVLSEQLKGAVKSVVHRQFRQPSPTAMLKAVSASDILVLWLRPDEIARLIAELPDGPLAERVFASALFATPGTVKLPPAWKTRIYYVSLFDDLGYQGEIARLRLGRWLDQAGLPDTGNRRLQADVYAACYLINDALGEIREQEVRRPEVPLNREHLLETLETLVNKYDDSTRLVNIDSHVAYYGRMSLGPRQRVAVRGGTIMRYQSAESNRLTPVSKRIVP